MKLTNICTMLLCALIISSQAKAEKFIIGGIEHQANLLEKKDIGPGTTHMRWRLPDYPLNVNVITVDMTNPFCHVETMQAYETIGRTESFVSAAKRLNKPFHKPLGGANGNFWCVSGQAPWSDLLIGTTFGGNVKNAQIITETNAYSDQWCGGPQNTCVIATDTYGLLWIEPMLWRGYVESARFSTTEFIQVNKVVRENELALYNTFYPSDKAFQPVNQVDNHFVLSPGDAVEVYISRLEGQQWMVGNPVRCRVEKVLTNAGNGTRGQYEAVLVGRGGYAEIIKNLEPGDEITIEHGWTSYKNGKQPIIENLMQGLSLCMADGVKIPEGNNNSYNNTIYPRTGYGSSADRHTLYMITIDKSTDPVYGASAGCNTDVMCDIAAALGCANLSSVDAGGSTQMLVQDKIVNTTTESSPRAIANGWMVFSTAPEDNDIARIEFNDVTLKVPPYASISPHMLGYNRFGDLIDEYLLGCQLSCTPDVGSCSGDLFIAGKGGSKGTLTATFGDISVSCPVEVVDTDIKVRLDPIVIDNSREYLLEVNAMLDGKSFKYEPTELQWDIHNPNIAMIDHHGLLHGLANGTTSVSASIGDFSDTVTLKVEIPSAPKISHYNWENWNTKCSSGLKQTSWNQGILSYTYNSPRIPSVTLSNNLTLYSLPDEITLTFKSSIAVEKLIIDIRTREHSRANQLTVTPPDNSTQWNPNTEYTVNIPFPGEPLDLGTYPITLHGITAYLKAASTNKGTQSFELVDVAAHYKNYTEGVDDITIDNNHRDNSPEQYYNLQGIKMPSAPLTPGIYIRIKDNKTTKIIVR